MFLVSAAGGTRLRPLEGNESRTQKRLAKNLSAVVDVDQIQRLVLLPTTTSCSRRDTACWVYDIPSLFSLSNAGFSLLLALVVFRNLPPCISKSSSRPGHNFCSLGLDSIMAQHLESRLTSSRLVIITCFSSTMSPLTDAAARLGVGAVTGISITSYLQVVLPPLRHDLDPAVIDAKLNSYEERLSSQEPIVTRNRWRGFAQDPALATGAAEDAFRHFPDAVEAIVQAGRAVSGECPLSISFSNNPNCKMWYLDRGDGTPKYPDAYLIQGDGLSWSSIIASGEYTKTDSNNDAINVSYSLALYTISRLIISRIHAKFVALHVPRPSSSVYIRLHD